MGYKQVSEQEFKDFIKSFPRKLEEDLYMDWYTWNDFSDGKIWPESIVCKAEITHEGERKMYIKVIAS